MVVAAVSVVYVCGWLRTDTADVHAPLALVVVSV